MTIPKIPWKAIGNLLSDHAPTILTGIGIGGFVSATVIAVARAKDYHEERESTATVIKEYPDGSKSLEVPRKLTAKEEITIAAKHFWPSALLIGGGAGCIILANRLNLQRQAALAAAYSLSESALRNYKAGTLKALGEKEEAKVVHEMNEERLTNGDLAKIQDSLYFNTGRGTQKCIDTWTGAPFLSNTEAIREALNEFNADMIECGYGSYNELYDKLNLPETESGSVLGWYVSSRADLLRVSFDAQMRDGEAVVLVSFQPEPYLDFRRR